MIKIKFTDSSTDPERAVLPSIVYCKVLEDGIVVRGIGLGWWKWGIIIAYTKG